MPKLSAQQAKTVAATQAAAAGGMLLEEGYYAAQLRSVEEKTSDNGDYWEWTFHNLHDQAGAKHPGRQWNNTSMGAKSAPFLKQTFDAFGYTTDSDTDEMINEWVTLYITQEVRQKGVNAGKLRNTISSLSPFVPSDFDFDADAEAVTAESGGSGSRDDY
jgi:hypothetical protein